MESPDQGTDHVTSSSKDCKRKRERSHSPEPSCVSMKRDRSKSPPQNFRNETSSSVHSKLQRERSHSPEPSCVSMKSGVSMVEPWNFRNEMSSPVPRHEPESTAVDEFQKKFKLNLMKKFQCLNGEMLKQEERTLLNEIYTELYITEGDSGDVNKEHEVKQMEAASRRKPTEETPIKCSDIFKPLSEQDEEPIRNVLTKLLSEQDEEPIRNILKKFLSEQDKEIIRKVLTKILSDQDEEPVRKVPKNVLSEQDKEFVRKRVKDLLYKQNKSIKRVFKKTLSEQDELLRRVLKKLLSKLDEEPIRRVLTKLLSEQDEELIRNVLTKLLSEEDEEPIRSVLTKGVAGIGKTVSVQKFVLDWAEGKTNQDVHLIFPLPFRELNLMKDQNLSLMELLHVFFKEIKEMDISSLEKVLFIFDGLDECRFPLDFQKTVRVCDVTESAPVHVLLINLIKGNLLPSALIWITSRPAAADQIPSECVHRVTEVRGFNDPQKEEYFRKRISDQNLAYKIITHLKSLRSLYIMCHIPVFCWISAAVLERMLGEAESGEIPKTLTQMYTHFLIIQTNIIREKYPQKQESHEEILLKLGKLAFQQLEKQNLIFYEEDLRECGVDVTEAAVYSGVCTQIFREEFGLHQSKVYSFVHLSIQEHLAALYVHLTFMKEQRNVLTQDQEDDDFSYHDDYDDDDDYNYDDYGHVGAHGNDDYSDFCGDGSHYNYDDVGYHKLKDCKTLSDVHRFAVVQALKSQTGHLDLFLRFLLGLSLESNQKLLHSLVTQTGSSSQNKEETVRYIKKKISEDFTTEKCINLIHCLNELGDDSLVEEIQQFLKSGTQSELSPSQWSALAFVLLTSAEDLEEFDLNKYITTEKIRDEILVRVMPVIAASRKTIIRCDEIKERSGEALISALNSETSNLRELHLTVDTLNLSENKLGDIGVKRLSALLENPECKVKVLSIRYNKITLRSSVESLASALNSETSNLRELQLTVDTLNLSNYFLNAMDIIYLPALLKNPECKVKVLRLELCGVSDEGCAALTSALRSNPSHLRYLDLSKNNIRDSGVKCLSDVLENPLCKLEILRLEHCGISDEGCAALVSALRSNPSHLRDLDLTENNLGDSGLKCLSALRNDLQTMDIRCDEITGRSGEALTAALNSEPSNLRELDLSDHYLSVIDMKRLCDLLENPECKVKDLRLRGVSDKDCADLASALRSNPSHLRELDLCVNNIRDSGVKCLSTVLENPLCKLEILRLSSGGFVGEGCVALASALRSNPSHLRELDLSVNYLEYSGVKCLSAALENPLCKLEILRLRRCYVSDEGCAALASALRSNPSHLRELDLSESDLRESGVKCLSVLKDDEGYKLQTLLF